MDSDEMDDPDMKPDVLENMYTAEMDPGKGPIKLTQSQVAAQKAAAHALKASKSPPRAQTPVTGSSDDDDPAGSQFIWSSSKGIFRRDKRWVDPKVSALPTAGTSESATGPGPSKGFTCPGIESATRSRTPSSDTGVIRHGGSE
jgi:hypothetical protein